MEKSKRTAEQAHLSIMFPLFNLKKKLKVQNKLHVHVYRIHGLNYIVYLLYKVF